MIFFRSIGNFLSQPIRIGGGELPFSLLNLLLEFVLPAVIIFVFYKIILMILKRLLIPSPEVEAEAEELRISVESRRKILKWTRLVFRILFIIVVLVLLGRMFGAEVLNYIISIFNFLNEPFFESGATKISVVTILLAIPIFYLATWLSRKARKMVEDSALIRDGLDPSKRFTIISLVRYGVLVLMVIIGLSLIGINLSSLAVIFGVLGIGLGFGLQGVVANFFAGLVIIFTKPIKEGDRIFVNSYDGTVINIRLIATIINTLTNETIIVPNSQIVGSSVHNYSYSDRIIAIVNSVQVSYSSDLNRVLEVLMDVGKQNPHGVKGRAPTALVKSFDDSGITVAIWSWIIDVEYKIVAHSWANLEIWRRFKEEGITIPFPQRDVHLPDQDTLPK